MELVHPLEPTGEESPLARARLHRQLTLEETARRAGITPEEVRWLEEGRVYRFPRPDDALARDRSATPPRSAWTTARRASSQVCRYRR